MGDTSGQWEERKKKLKRGKEGGYNLGERGGGSIRSGLSSTFGRLQGAKTTGR